MASNSCGYIDTYDDNNYFDNDPDSDDSDTEINAVWCNTKVDYTLKWTKRHTFYGEPTIKYNFVPDARGQLTILMCYICVILYL